ncbi:MAG: ABC transporter ATP-binding protein [Alphaproteobacteria bacterium]
MILSARGLSKTYGGTAGSEAVRDASLELRPGESVSIVGRSGSGKSTLLAMIGGLLRPDSGRVELDGIDLWALSEAERAAFRCRHLGFVFQFASLLPDLSVADNVAVPALLGRTMAPPDANRRAADLLAEVGLADRADAFPGDLSGGEQRRVAIARALINRPSLLLADEPTNDLDEDTEADIIGLIEELRLAWGFGVILVTHARELAGRAERGYEMRDGVLAPSSLLPLGEPRPLPQGQPARSPPAAAPPAATASERSPRLGADIGNVLRPVLLGGVVLAGFALIADAVIAKYQGSRLRERDARLARLADLAFTRLQGEIASIADLGGGRYELALALSNASGKEQPLYVMAPDMRAYVQVGKVWREVPLRPAEDSAAGVMKIDGTHTYRYSFEARLDGFTQLLPNYMHVRFSDTMLVNPSSTPEADLFERKDNYYVYLKPSDTPDEAILKRIKFTGKPPVWIPMPPH